MAGPEADRTRVPHRPVDGPPGGPPDPGTVRGRVPPELAAGVYGQAEPDLAEAGDAGQGAGPRGGRAVAGRGLAGHPKKGAGDRAHVVLIDETVLFLNPLVRRTWAPRGRPPLRGRPPFSTPGAGTGTGCARSGPCRFPRSPAGSGATSPPRRTGTTPRGRWSRSCAGCSGTCGEVLLDRPAVDSAAAVQVPLPAVPQLPPHFRPPARTTNRFVAPLSHRSSGLRGLSPVRERRRRDPPATVG